MVSILVQARGPADPELVWERYAQLDLWRTWSPQIRRVECREHELALGIEGTVHGPLGMHAAFVVTSCLPEHRTWSWMVRSGPIVLALEHAVHADPVGSRATLRLRGPALVVFGYAPLVRPALHRLVG
jgi:hypothetical protein